MLLFLFTLFPVSLILYWFYKKDPKIFIVMILGFFAAAVLCAINFFFQFSHRVVINSFGQNMWYFMRRLGLIPVVLIFAISFLVSKDDAETKIDFYIPLLGSYYAVLIPYFVISSTTSNLYTGFDLFIKPLIYVGMVFETGLLLKKFFVCLSDKRYTMTVLFGVLTAVFILLPSIIEALYIIAVPFWVVILLSLSYLVIPCYGIAFNLVLKRKSNE